MPPSSESSEKLAPRLGLPSFQRKSSESVLSVRTGLGGRGRGEVSESLVPPVRSGDMFPDSAEIFILEIGELSRLRMLGELKSGEFGDLLGETGLELLLLIIETGGEGRGSEEERAGAAGMGIMGTREGGSCCGGSCCCVGVAAMFAKVRVSFGSLSCIVEEGAGDFCGKELWLEGLRVRVEFNGGEAGVRGVGVVLLASLLLPLPLPLPLLVLLLEPALLWCCCCTGCCLCLGSPPLGGRETRGGVGPALPNLATGLPPALALRVSCGPPLFA